MDYIENGDIFATDAKCIVNPVNCVGVMGKGLALEFKSRFPAIMPAYTKVCQEKKMKPGMVYLLGVDRSGRTRMATRDADIIIANLATKDHWRSPSQIEWVDAGLRKLAEAIEERGIPSIAIPKLGAGLGRLSWEAVHEKIVEHFGPLSARGTKVIVLGEEPIKGLESMSSRVVPEAYEDGLKFYAGIGSRETPKAVEGKMEKVASILGKDGAILRSGGADSADSAFERGADKVNGPKEIFLPWDGFSGRHSSSDAAAHRFVFVGFPSRELTERAAEIAAKYHPAWDRLTRGPRSLMARNGAQMLGQNLDRKTDLVLCWTKCGQPIGGTGQALRMAADIGVEVINFGLPKVNMLSAEQVAEAARMVFAGEKAEAAIEAASRLRPKQVGQER